MLDPAFFRDYQPLPSPFWERLGSRSWSMMERRSKTVVVVEGMESVPKTPVLFATNSTQKYDFMPIRTELLRRSVPTVTVTKGKNYHSAVMGGLLKRLGVIPIASRGYILLVDFTKLLGRRPTEDEYRALRRHFDEGVALPSGPPFEQLTTTARLIVGHVFDPAAEPYRSALQRVYAFMMEQTLRLTREAVQAGSHVQIYPEGTVSSRLGTGRIGTVQFAHALRVPIVPVGMSGCREAFVGSGLRLRGGTVTLRFGAPFVPSLDALPPTFQPFNPEHENEHRPVLQAATDEVMNQIDVLLDEPYRRKAGVVSDSTQGTRRFL